MLKHLVLAALLALPAWSQTIVRPDLGPQAAQQLRDLHRALQKLNAPPGGADEIAAGRAWLAGREVVPAPQGRWQTLASGLRLRILEPHLSRGVYLFIHGGGWCVGSALSGEEALWKLAQRLQVTVVSVDYRLAPEHPYPAALDDCLEASQWVAHSFPAQPRLLGGASAGAHLAALTAVREGRHYAGLLLWYGAHDVERRYPGRDSEHPDLPPDLMGRFRDRFLSQLERSRWGEASPLHCDLRALPPTLLIVGDADLLYPDSVRLASVAAQADVPTQLLVYAGAGHGFDGYPTLSARDAQRRAERFLRGCLSGGSPRR